MTREEFIVAYNIGYRDGKCEEYDSNGYPEFIDDQELLKDCTPDGIEASTLAVLSDIVRQRCEIMTTKEAMQKLREFKFNSTTKDVDLLAAIHIAISYFEIIEKTKEGIIELNSKWFHIGELEMQAAYSRILKKIK